MKSTANGVQQPLDLAQALFQESADALFLLDPGSGKLLDINPVALRLTGFGRSEILQHPASYLFRAEHQGGRSRLRSAVGETVVFHARDGYLLRTSRDGEWVPVNLSISRLHVRPHALALITVRDVRERREAEEAVRRQQALLEQVIAHVPCAVFWKDRRGVYLGCNEQSARDLGLESAGQVAGKTDHDLQFDKEEADFFVRCDREVMDGGRPLLDIEETQRRPDGGRAVLLTSKVPLRDASGEVFGVLGVYADITRRKRAEEALRENEEKYRALFERNPQPMFVYDAETLRYLAVNDAMVHQYGYTREEFSRMTLKDLRPPEDVPALLEMLSTTRPVFERRGVWRHRKKDGTLLDAEIVAHGLRFGGRDAYIVAALDVTERRRLEEQLRQSQKMEAVGRLAGGVAHDFNNLLTVIQGYGHMLAGHLDADDPAGAMAREITHAAERAAELTGQLLAFGRKAMTAPRLLDLNTVLSDAERMLRRVIGEDVALAVDLGCDARPVRADPGQLHQVLMNLAVNARDAMPRGGRLTLRTRDVHLNDDRVRPGPYVLLEVSDTGCGMTEEVRSRVFEPFFTTKEPGKGTGLGLATVYGIVTQAEGHVAVRSAPGRGCTFEIYWPRAQEAAAAAASPPPGPAPAGCETVLLAEDEDGVRALTRQVLEGLGYRVLEAEDGEAALRAAAGHAGRIDLLATDVVMPILSGPELARRLAALRPATRVLFLSGYTDDAVMRHGVREEEVNFLQKPFTPSALARKVRDVLDR